MAAAAEAAEARAAAAEAAVRERDAALAEARAEAAQLRADARATECVLRSLQETVSLGILPALCIALYCNTGAGLVCSNDQTLIAKQSAEKMCVQHKRPQEAPPGGGDALLHALRIEH